MKVEIWSDYQCPFCYIGKRRFEKALHQFGQGSQVEVEFKSFELQPDAELDSQMSQNEMLMKKYNMSAEQVNASNNNLTAQAKAEGLDYHLEQTILTNTFDAHRLTQFAETKGKGKEMAERLFYAYFTEAKHLGDRKILVALAEEVGLDRRETEDMLESNLYTAEVRTDEQEGSLLGVRGVPFFVINRKYGISGAQPTEVFLQTLQKVWAEENSLQMVNEPENANGCTDESCNM
jgi:predicted DsbA family dithiol-disulfide isomerase